MASPECKVANKGRKRQGASTGNKTWANALLALSMNCVITVLVVMGTGVFQLKWNVWRSHNDMVAKQNGWSIVKFLATTRTHTIVHFHGRSGRGSIKARLMVRCIAHFALNAGTTTQGSPNKNLARTLGARILPWHMPWRIPWVTHSLEWLWYIGEILIDCGSLGCRWGLPSRGPINFTGILEGTLEGGLRERPFVIIPLTIILIQRLCGVLLLKEIYRHTTQKSQG